MRMKARAVLGMVSVLFTMGIVVALVIGQQADSASGGNEVPGGALDAEGAFEFPGGVLIPFELHAGEHDVVAGIGVVSFQVGHAANMCSVNGPDAELESYPMTEVQCGESDRAQVHVDGCRASVEFPAYVHASYPHTAFLGLTTVEVAFDYKEHSSPYGEVTIIAYTPNGDITLGGKVLEGEIPTMDTCQLLP